MPAPHPLMHEALMQEALRAGRTMHGRTWPNPAVGCVLADPHTGAIIATGCTQAGGRPHAEMDALAKAGAQAQGAVAYVTLEPCNHTSPAKPCACTQGLIEAGVSKLFVAMPDPDARMAGKSIERLRQAGLEVDVGLCAREAAHDHRGHISRTQRKRPYITLKLAHSRDGKLGLAGQRTPITGPASQARVHALRAMADAVMVGIGTVLADNPQLTDRREDATHQPVRIVLDTRARLPLGSMLAQTAQETPVWLLASAPAPALGALGVRVIPCGMDIHAVMQALYEAGLSHILVEGGATLARTLLDEKLADEVLMLEGPTVLGHEAIPCPQPIGLALQTIETFGNDIWRTYATPL